MILGLLLLWGTLAAVPTAVSQTTAEAHPLLELHLADGALTPDAPTGEEDQTGSIVGTAVLPGVSYNRAWGGWEATSDFTFTTDAVATIYLTSNNRAVVYHLRGYIDVNGDQVAQGQTGDDPDTGGGDHNILESGEIERYQFGIPLKGISVAAGDEIALRIYAKGLGHENDQTDIRAVYGSLAHDSKISVGVDNAELPISGQTRDYYLGDAELTTIVPTGEESKSRVAESAYQGQSITLASAGAMTWGETEAGEDLTQVADATLTFWVTGDDAPAVLRGVRPSIVLDGTEYTQSAGIEVTAWPVHPVVGTSPSTIDNAVFRYVVGFNTQGVGVASDSVIEVLFRTWDSGDDRAGQVYFLYGSAVHDARVTLRVAADGAASGGPEVPAELVSAAAVNDTASAAPGASAEFQIELENLAGQDLNLTFESSGNATAEIADLHLPANTTATHNVTVAVPEDAEINATIPLTVSILGPDGSELANVTLSVDVVAATVLAQDEGADPLDSEDANATDPADQPEAAGVPGPGLVAVVAAALIGAFALRRRD